METNPGTNLLLVLAAWADASSSGSAEPFAAILADDVVWDGRLPDQRCRGRQEAMDFLSRGALRARITRLDIRESGDEVIATADGPDFVDIGPDGETVPRASASMIFTIKDGVVVHMKGG